MQWQYAQIGVFLADKRTVTKIFGAERTVLEWVVQVFGPDGEQSSQTKEGPGHMPIVVLNRYGQMGWEVVTASQGGGRFDYLLKRPRK